ncbi:MAG: helix-turn-helix transcriptional regulator [Leptolyngbyaceae cyanobacterium SM1_4_3]|nr:helix-turn-helix transcriptional regulator [Leptolyngbyaceae cyanobacterium SM1_4_3]
MATTPGTPIEHRTDVSKFIRQLRNLLELTQAQFALKLGVASPTIVRWENNKTQPSQLALLQLKAMLQELTNSSDEVQQAYAQALLTKYFGENF